MVLLRRSCNVVEDTLLRIPVEGRVRVRGVGLELALGYPHLAEAHCLLNLHGCFDLDRARRLGPVPGGAVFVSIPHRDDARFGPRLAVSRGRIVEVVDTLGAKAGLHRVH